MEMSMGTLIANLTAPDLSLAISVQEEIQTLPKHVLKYVETLSKHSLKPATTEIRFQMMDAQTLANLKLGMSAITMFLLQFVCRSAGMERICQESPVMTEIQ